jgi:hypothetical protein
MRPSDGSANVFNSARPPGAFFSRVASERRARKDGRNPTNADASSWADASISSRAAVGGGAEGHALSRKREADRPRCAGWARLRRSAPWARGSWAAGTAPAKRSGAVGAPEGPDEVDRIGVLRFVMSALSPPDASVRVLFGIRVVGQTRRRPRAQARGSNPFAEGPRREYCGALRRRTVRFAITRSPRAWPRRSAPRPAGDRRAQARGPSRA